MYLSRLRLTSIGVGGVHGRCALATARTVAFAVPMKNEKGKTVKKENLPSKTCATCGRPFTWCEAQD